MSALNKTLQNEVICKNFQSSSKLIQHMLILQTIDVCLFCNTLLFIMYNMNVVLSKLFIIM